MGRGYYTSADWSKLKASAKISDSSSTSQIFKKTSMDERFDPKFINVREARDSEDHPDTTPIIIGLDVTGSMGYLSTQIAKESLNETMLKLYSTGVVPGPQLMFAAVGDVVDKAPLQVTQFESDVRIGEQLLDLWLEGRGGDMPEDYELLWYFAANHTKIDSFEKRNKKGFLITIGDADIHTTVNGSDIERLFGDPNKNYTSKAILAEAEKKYHVFHINIGMNTPKEFGKLLPGHVANIGRNEINFLPQVIISILQCTYGEDKQKAISQWEPYAWPVVKNALSSLSFNQKKKGFFF